MYGVETCADRYQYAAPKAKFRQLMALNQAGYSKGVPCTNGKRVQERQMSGFR